MYYPDGDSYDFVVLTKDTGVIEGWSGGAMVLCELPGQGHRTNLDYSIARAYCACRRCGWDLFGHFSVVYHFSFLSLSLSGRRSDID